ncbi:serine/threonine-protein kinase [Arthrobacter sp. ES3-54]|uniref:serine/threonine-protein kinase n=1 Tax=Arthrobacter sp. ES3-54 TaxID=1502991 RepID=UPI002404ADE3|nr:serine/threonine-protein kinase [Arthrobacter sp. ES3-54]MDF9751767.1 hypothetical protein [Arthrobacter sp. ES3-54]
MEDLPAVGSAAPEVPGYDVGRLLGRGGTAAVWLVTDRSTGREFALKCFDNGGEAGKNDGGTADREAEEAMRREVRILSALDHDHLLRAHTVQRLRGPRPGPDDKEALGLVLDYAPGGSVADLVTGRGRLGAGETVTVLTPIAQALQYLHSHGFTHGDVSPGNVLFTAHGKPLLADVGVARMVGDAGAAHAAGTEGFSDPAPVDAVRAGLQPECDVYSLAALGWYCLTGQAPVPGAGRPPLPLLVPEVPAALAAALESGLDEDRRKRPSAAELAAAIYRSTAAEPVDLSVTAHPSVAPHLLTRRTVPRSARERRAERLRGWFRRPFVGRAPMPGRAANAAPAAAPGPFNDAAPDTGADSFTASGSSARIGSFAGEGRLPDTGRAAGRAVPGMALAAPAGAHARTSAVSTARHAASGPAARHSAAGHNAGPNAGPVAGRSNEHNTVGEEARRETVRGIRPGVRPRIRHGDAFDPGRGRGRRKLWAGAAVAVMLVAGLCAAWLRPGGGIAELFAASASPASVPPAAAPGAAEAGTDGSSRSGGPGNPGTGSGASATAGPAAASIPGELRELLESADPGQAVRGLAALRSLAFSSGNLRLLQEVNVPASAAADADATIGARLAAAGHVLSGFETTLARVQTVVDGGPDRTVVAVSAVSSPYQERDAAGQVVAEAPAGKEIRLRLVLASIDGRWRIAQVLGEDPASG